MATPGEIIKLIDEIDLTEKALRAVLDGPGGGAGVTAGVTFAAHHVEDALTDFARTHDAADERRGPA